MRNTVLHIQAKVHPVTASISVKFRGMKEDVDISKPWTSHFRISYRSRDICLDYRSYINISDWMVQKIIFTETIIYKWSSLCILLILHLMVLANLYFKDIGSTQTLIFSPNTVFHFLHYSQQLLHHVYFLQFSLTSVWPPHFYISLWNLQIALVTDVPKVIIITLVLFGQSKAAYWQRWYKIYVTKVFCIYKKLFRNRSQRTVRAWLMFYETFVCFYVSEAKHLCFSLCSQTFNVVEQCWIYNIQNVCHANEQLSLFISFQLMLHKTLRCSSARPFVSHCQ